MAGAQQPSPSDSANARRRPGLVADVGAAIHVRLMMMVPGKAITPAELGSAIVYLASREARMVTGAVLAFDGGM